MRASWVLGAWVYCDDSMRRVVRDERGEGEGEGEGEGDGRARDEDKENT